MNYIIGIDEVGRGPIAGPVTLCAAIAEPGFEKELLGIKDSKQLTSAKREEWYARLQEFVRTGSVRFAVAHVEAHIIDSIGIAPAIRQALAQTLTKLAVDPVTTHIMLDGSLKAPKEFSQETIIKGDEKIPLISLASIAAKVQRDALMVAAAGKYPGYGFERHKGYGTKAHYEALRRLGLSPLHRKSFLSSLNNDIIAS